MRQHFRTKNLISHNTPDGKSIVGIEVKLYKKIQTGTITQEELKMFVELTHREEKKMEKIIESTVEIIVFGRKIMISREEYERHATLKIQ